MWCDITVVCVQKLDTKTEHKKWVCVQKLDTNFRLCSETGHKIVVCVQKLDTNGPHSYLKESTSFSFSSKFPTLVPEREKVVDGK